MLTTQRVPPVRIAVDIGGTFTDLQIFDARTGAITSLKTLTTPEDPSIGLMAGIEEAAARDGFALADIGYLLHGTTIATNAVLERKLAPGRSGYDGLLRGCARDRPSLPARHLFAQSAGAADPDPARPPDRHRGAHPGRRQHRDAADEAALEGADRQARSARCRDGRRLPAQLLRQSAHETRIAEHLARGRPALKVSCSSALNAEIREYERTSTTVLNALLIPVIASYLDKLARRMRAENCTPRLLLVQSNGGVCSTETAAQQPVRLLLSGPSGGSAACALLGQVLGEANIVGVDMGGTSFDVSVVRDGRVNLITQGEIDKMPVRLPMVEIRTIGAGGGRSPRSSAGGRLRSGRRAPAHVRGPPAMAAAAPSRPSRMRTSRSAGSTATVSSAAACSSTRPRRATAIEAHVAQPLGLAVEPAAEGLLAVTNANLGAAIRLSLFEKGLDPRDFVMIAFGGAAGLHAIAVADELGIRRVIFPENASTLSAYGILHSDLAHDLARSQCSRQAENLPTLAAMANCMLEEAEAGSTPTACRPRTGSSSSPPTCATRARHSS